MGKKVDSGGAVGALQGPHSGQRSGGRFSVRRKREAVLRLLGGATLDSLSRELGVTAATLSDWRDRFLAGAETALKTRPHDDREEQLQRFKAKLGEVLLDNELLQSKIDRMEQGLPLARRRSRR